MRAIRLLPLLCALSSLLPAQWVRHHRPTPKAGEFFVLKADLHMHTVFSDGLVWPTVRVQEAWREDLDVMSITDHDDYRPHEKDVSTNLARPYEIARPLAEGLGILIVPGVEITKGDIHFNALFIQDHNAFRGKELQSALAEARRQGAWSFWNHPGWRGRAQWWPPIATAYSDKLFQGIEIVNGPSYYDEAHPWIGQYNLAVIANSDIHGPSIAVGERSLTLLLARERTLVGVREALDAHRTIAWQGKRLIGTPANLTTLVQAYLQTPARVQTPAGARTAALTFRNDSALHFDLKPLETPAWLDAASIHVPPQSTAVLQLRLKPEAPKTAQKVTLRFEVSNSLAGPGQPLDLPVAFELVP